MRGIEPPYLAWEANVLPLNYTRKRLLQALYHGRVILTLTLLVQHDLEEEVVHVGHTLL